MDSNASKNLTSSDFIDDRFKLELSRLGTYPARCICVNLRAATIIIIMHAFVDDLYLRMLVQLQKAHRLVDRRGQQKRYL